MRIAIAGGSAAGLSAGLLLARSGHEVVVLDRDPLVPEPDVESAAAAAFRPSAPQIVQPHALLARARNLLRERLPDVFDALLAAGAVEAPLRDQFPPTLVDRAPKAGDEQLTMIMTRRSTFDWVLLRAAVAQPGLRLCGRTRVTGLSTTPGSPPQVRGLSTSVGDVPADAVVDATGRRSPVDAWLRTCGGAPSDQQAAECGLAYYSRHYRLRAGTALPGPAGTRLVAAFDEFTAGIWAGDNGTMLFAIAPLTADRRFRRLTDPDVFAAVLRTVPSFGPWLEVLEPITAVHAMAGLHNTMRRLVVDGVPVLSGLFAVGDSVCTTNPTLGRGIALALQECADLADVLGRSQDPVGAAIQLDRRISEQVLPFYADQVTNDAARLSALRHTVLGHPLADPAPRCSERVDFAQLRSAAMVDPLALRAFFRLLGMLDVPEVVYGDAVLAGHVQHVLGSSTELPRLPQPDRADLLLALGIA
jgi:2-polyprenyl-6-methoxyphenol hydroxylase-like FAD-dependent oxidoreductase